MSTPEPASDDRGRRARSLADATGRALRRLDLLCGWLYVLGGLFVGGSLAQSALTRTAWLWLLAGPVLATSTLFAIGLLRNPERGLHLPALSRRAPKQARFHRPN